MADADPSLDVAHLSAQDDDLWLRRARRSPAIQSPLPAEIAFLEDRLADHATLQRAARLAASWRVSPEQVLIDTGMVEPTAYYKALAEHAGLPFLRLKADDVDWYAFAHRKGAAMANVNIVPLKRKGRGLRVAVAPHGRGLRTLLMLARRPDAANQLGGHVHISTPRDVARAIEQGQRDQLRHHAADALRLDAPHLSAAGGATMAQRAAFAVAVAGMCAASLIAAKVTASLAVLALSLIFAGLAVLRIGALFNHEEQVAHLQEKRCRDADLPAYTVLVPLYREEEVLPRLVDALCRLDYPASKLDVKLIFEGNDPATLAAAKKLKPPPHFSFIVVPQAGPQTKPKALNYALQFARGNLVTIYDAEDRPEPDQLRKAVAAFRAGGPNLACLQARLSFHNADENWLARQFAIEYAALFDAVLPALAAARLPLPLGGTSNHFRRGALEAVGRWDPYNVTEDADLGMRLARLGYACGTLNSVTHEEACATPLAWLKQRTRWLKGWMQTFVVHMRHPGRLWHELSPGGFATFQLLTAGTIVSALFYPFFAGLLAWALLQHGAFGQESGTFSLLIAFLGLFNAVLGYGAAFAAAATGLKRRGLTRLLRHIVFMPVYWLGISLAAWRALWQFAVDPFRWEKTQHRHIGFTLAQR